MEDICGVYGIRRVGTSHRYIGSSTNCAKRWREHVRALKKGIHTSKYLQASWNKHGAEEFVFEIIEVCSREQRLIREQHYLVNLDSRFNMSKLAAGGSAATDWIGAVGANRIAKISESNKGKHNLTHTDDTKLRIGEASRLWWETHEATEAQRAFGQSERAAKGRKNSPANKPGWMPEHRIGVKDTEDTIEKRRSSRLATEQNRRDEGILYVWINDGTRGQKIVVGTPIPDGWMLGRQPSYVEKARLRKGETRDAAARENMRQAQLASNKARAATGTPHHNVGVQQNYCWITDGVANKRQLKTQPIPVGWRRGRVISTR